VKSIKILKDRIYKGRTNNISIHKDRTNNGNVHKDRIHKVSIHKDSTHTDRKIFYKLNNQGSTLLTIIICIAFISILGAMILSAAMTNLQMKIVDSKSKKNFYSCEIVLDKFSMAVQETVSEAIRSVYEDEVLVNYAAYLGYEQEYRNTEIQKMVIARFMQLAGGANAADAYADILSKAAAVGYSADMNYFSDKKYLTSDEQLMINDPLIKYETDGSSNNSIRLENIRIEYIDNGYRTAISTDIVAVMPEFSFSGEITETQYSMEQPFKKYVLMTDGQLISNNIDGTTDILGNVYSGRGIYINGQNSGRHVVNINGSLIATERDITVSDTALLNLGAAGEEPTAINPVIWADNMITLTTPAYNTSSSVKTGLHINGISVIRDDLNLEGRNSDVALDGAYIGFTGTNSSEGSSMIINGAGSRLDLSQLEELILAGRAKVSVQDITLNKDTDILTGESLAIKSDQRAYLLPGRFIQGLYHNPLTQEDYTGGTMPSVVIDDTAEAIKFNSYINKLTPYQIAAKQTGDAILRYYYLNFARGWKADAYFADFFNLYRHTQVFDSLAPFSVNEVILPVDGDIYAAGNLMSYNSEAGLQLTTGMSNQPEYKGDLSIEYDDLAETTFDTKLNNAIADISLDKELYSSTVLASSKVGLLGSIYYDTFEDVAQTIKEGGVDYIIGQSSEGKFDLSSPYINDYNLNTPVSGLIEYKNSNPSKQSFWIIDGDVIISGSDGSPAEPVFNGIMIATGDITISDNAFINGIVISTGETGSGKVTVGDYVNMNGRIVTKGDIYLGQSCKLMADVTTDDYLDTCIFTQEADILRYLFKGSILQVDFTIETPVSDLVDLTNMLSYEKWKKIE
jgi:hypothetical protein